MEAPICRTCGKRHWARVCPDPPAVKRNSRYASVTHRNARYACYAPGHMPAVRAIRGGDQASQAGAGERAY